MNLQQNCLSISKRKCLNERHNGAACYHCVQHCPGKALMLYEYQVYLDNNNCLGCGLCLADCPTGAFVSSQWNEAAIRTDAEEITGDTVQIFCGNYETFAFTTEDKPKGIITLPGCLSMISRGGWYELGLLKKIELRVDKCENCLMKGCLYRLEFAVITAQEWLIACGYPQRLIFVTQKEGKLKEKKLKVDPSGLPVTSRRDLFLKLVNKGKSIQHPSKETNPIHLKNEKQDVAFNCADWQLRLARLYPSHCKAEGDFAYWPDILVNMDCVHCGMCATYCPTKALRISQEGNISQRYFTSGYCLDCRICMISCPKQCVQRDRVQMENPFETKLIFKAKTNRCRCCDSSTLENEDNLCYWCRSEAKDEDIIASVINRSSAKRSD